MGWYSRFGRASNEFGRLIKSNPLVTGFEGGAREGLMNLQAHALEPVYSAMIAERPMLSRAARGAQDLNAVFPSGVPKKTWAAYGAKVLAKSVGHEFAFTGAGIAAGYGYGQYRRHQGEHVGRGRMLAYMAVGGKLGSVAGSGYTFSKLDPNNGFKMLARSPLDAWRASRLSV